ncbi:MAG TPA: peptidylprolyl isomerase, partial [Blastocatellia bacterium]|nr:peptidylprolyl isomerase [Blastocatellia bacterium]
ALLSIFAAACSSPNSGTSGSVKTAGSPPPLAAGEEIAVIETDFGKIKFRFFPDVAPKHVEHFKKLIREGFYNGLAFHRVIPNGIIQGGDPTTRGNDRSRWGMGEPGQETVPAEFNDRPFVRGTVGAARSGDPDSATSQFFICFDEHPEWNGNYTVFGHVIEGINVVQIITNAPRDEQTEQVLEKVVMNRVYLEPYQKK